MLPGRAAPARERRDLKDLLLVEVRQIQGKRFTEGWSDSPEILIPVCYTCAWAFAGHPKVVLRSKVSPSH